MSNYVKIPEEINEKMKAIDVTGDVVFVKKFLFDISLGNNVKFTTIENLVDQKLSTLAKAIRNI